MRRFLFTYHHRSLSSPTDKEALVGGKTGMTQFKESLSFEGDLCLTIGISM